MGQEAHRDEDNKTLCLILMRSWLWAGRSRAGGVVRTACLSDVGTMHRGRDVTSEQTRTEGPDVLCVSVPSSLHWPALTLYFNNKHQHWSRVFMINNQIHVIISLCEEGQRRAHTHTHTHTHTDPGIYQRQESECYLLIGWALSFWQDSSKRTQYLSTW